MAKKKLKNKAKRVVKPSPVVDNVIDDVNPVTTNAPTPPIIPVFLKVCRLCENKDGPFLNIFDADGVTVKKIEDLMPFSVTENDDLPHKICFRCSAKLEELYEFIQKCIRTQENLRSEVGKTGPYLTKSKMGKKVWEDKLHKTKMSNDDICDALIKKAMEGIKSISPSLSIVKEENPSETKRVARAKEPVPAKDVISDPKTDDTDEMPLKQVKLSLEKNETRSPIGKLTRSSKQCDTEIAKLESSSTVDVENVEAKKSGEVKRGKTNINKSKKQETLPPTQNKRKASTEAGTLSNVSFDYPPQTTPIPVKESSSNEEPNKQVPEKPFNIMDHISMIKVNGVGILFQCKLCNRNFLKMDIVESHSCAKNGIPKVDLPKSVPVPEPPKMPTVKYIKIDTDMKKSLTEKVRLAEKSENDKTINLETNLIEKEKVSETPKLKPKPKVGPASKTKQKVIDLESDSSQSPVEPPKANPPPVVGSVHVPSMPNLNGRFKLVPGPNNVFSLVEDTSSASSTPVAPGVKIEKPNRKRKSSDNVSGTETNLKNQQVLTVNSEVIDLEDPTQPYPVGLFQTVNHSQPTPPTFTTPAMKKQSYTIVPTGNPSKLLISTKAKAVEPEVPKKRQRKLRHDLKEDSPSKEPYTVTLEDVAPPKDTGFFTFINVDPLLQPSYVLPTDNIIQESQISTSSAVMCQTADSKETNEKGLYTCNMCNESFSREKKLLSHIHSHFTKMDQEDQMRAEKASKKKMKK